MTVPYNQKMKNLHFIILVMGVTTVSVLCLCMSLNEAKAILPETQFQLKVNQTLTMDSYGIKVTFLNIISDSRCPYDVTCIWQGEARALVNIIENNQDRGNFTLSTLSGHDQIVFGTHTLHLLQVKPSVSSTKKISHADYVITLVMSGAYIESPLKQFKSGVAAKDVKCRDGLQFIVKNENGHFACVKKETANQLFNRGWGIFPLGGLPTSHQNT
jgi:hypothetical protein